MKIINAQQARVYNIYRNTKLKLLKANAAVRFKKMCKVKELKRGCINIRINGNTLQDWKTTHNAVKFRISKEIKFLYRGK